MDIETQYLTREKFTELEKELAYLKAERRKEVAEHLEYAKKLGDLSENAEYHQAREEQAEVEDRIGRLENLLKNAKITETHGVDKVTIGSSITVEREGDNKSMLYTIVGSEEADTSQGKISNLSPIGAALIGHKEGDVVSVSTPKGVAKYKITKIK
jgi:transcription elongation factor GreA